MTPARIGNVISSSAMGPSLRRDDDAGESRLPARYLGPQLVFLLAQLWSEFIAKVVGFEDLPDLHFGVVERRAPEPRDRLILRLHLPDPEACNQLLRLGERSVDHRRLAVRELHAGALGTRLEPVARQHHASLYQLFIERTHPGELLAARKCAGLGLVRGLYQNHESHCPNLLCFGWLMVACNCCRNLTYERNGSTRAASIGRYTGR